MGKILDTIIISVLTSATKLIKGEGSISVIIKPLEAALASNDRIYAVVGVRPYVPSPAVLI